ncbi:bifunctional ADP-dependent NAD(P)H-hydrate dehydratase/NAD(P)H-hydrate epimerase, partial [bacterium]|nr:bifunctional ADP-dependent NAD(P)H-hydrate dehydratase/NAD(P)H-hydrate epimerase [bacterium]
MRLVTTDEMRAIDSRAIDGLGIPGLTLMESAGMGTVQFIESELGDPAGARIVIICGKGNNGGDGFVIARGLRDRGAEVGVYLLGKPGELAGDARTNYERL